jgi:pSer/pThr/pTyr-binding forkhead associated (FHA) protein
MAAKLIEPASGPEEIREYPITGEEFLIGRGTDCDLRLGISDISRHHCLIRMTKGAGRLEATLSDLGSINGTYVNGKRVRSQVDLKTSDEIRIGACRLIVDLGDVPVNLDMPAGADPNATTARVRPPIEPRPPA